MVEDLYYKTAHYNLKYKTGILLNRVKASDLRGIRPQDIAFLWIVDQERLRDSGGNSEAMQSCSEALKVNREISLTLALTECATKSAIQCFECI